MHVLLIRNPTQIMIKRQYKHMIYLPATHRSSIININQILIINFSAPTYSYKFENYIRKQAE